MQQQVKPIYLVQRGTINRPLSQYTDVRISEAIDLDYMGSSEFEFGALPKSLRAFEAEADALNSRVVPSVTDAEGPA